MATSGRRGACSASLLALALACAGQAAERADVVGVEVAGEPGRYQLSVSLRSPDRDCSRYASWWEVVREDGSLAYRRILLHSHPDEQPFTRSGGPVPIQADETVVVRAHLHPEGYGGAVFRGSPSRGFARWEDAPGDFAAALAKAPPQPRRCLR